MEITGIHLSTIPIHVACMYHLKHLHARLFILAHELVDKEPESAMSWYSVGVWYLVASKWREAKQYLSKTTIMDSRHAPGWIAFAHTFAKEGEHEHAITAYSTCARLFRGWALSPKLESTFVEPIDVDLIYRISLLGWNTLRFRMWKWHRMPWRRLNLCAIPIPWYTTSEEWWRTWEQSECFAMKCFI